MEILLFLAIYAIIGGFVIGATFAFLSEKGRDKANLGGLLFCVLIWPIFLGAWVAAIAGKSFERREQARKEHEAQKERIQEEIRQAESAR